MPSRNNQESECFFPLFETLAKELDSAQKPPPLGFFKRLRDATSVELALRQQAVSDNQSQPLAKPEFYEMLDGVTRGFRNGRQQLQDPQIARFYFSIRQYPDLLETVSDLAAAFLVPTRMIPDPPRNK